MERKYIRALEAPDYEAFRNHHVDDPISGPCQWFLLDETVRRWQENEKSSILWIQGPPGQGKTVLSKFLLGHLEKSTCGPASDVTIIYFFFYYQDERFQTVDAALRSLITQLLLVQDVFQHVWQRINLDSSKYTRHSLWEILRDILHSSIRGTVYCVLDALDECREEAGREEEARQWLLERIKSLIQIPSASKTLL